MLEYIKKRWQNYNKTKSVFSKISDIIFVLLVVGMLIPASRRQISAFMAGLLATSPKTIEKDQQDHVSAEAYQWEFSSLDGETVRLSDFGSQPVFLNFWATWCPPCIAEMPDIQDLYDNYGDKAAFLLVTNEEPAIVRSFMKKRGFNMPVYIQKGGVPPVFASNSIPTTFLISAEGNVLIRKTGAAKWNSKKMQATMKQLTDLNQ
ncbi:MAG: redoxin [Bacteroidetes bacterium HGW-Bacteroidetes-1]|jgi:thiol-disulfide isomerase/thioredoxin|nr:MAG: redoxin [Bacteroidetes bacterium HGW-Bacteroidetes-1]